LKSSPDLAKHVDRLKRDLDASTKKDLSALVPKLVVWMRPIVQQITQI